MYDIFAGYRIVEVSLWTFVPSAGAVCAEWGADVVKVEHPNGGDPQRTMFAGADSPPHLRIMVEHVNRGKKSVAIDLAQPAGRELLLGLTGSADVFLTSFLTPARKRLRIDVDDLRESNPQLVYARGSGHGSRGPDADVGGYDMSSGWARPGLATELMAKSATEPPLCPPAIVDLQSGFNLASGIAGALLRRERTGITSVVDVSLLSSGMWLVAPNLLAASSGERVLGTTGRLDPPIHPMVNSYPTADERWIYFVFLEADRYWEEFCRKTGRDDLLRDTRFNSAQARRRNRAACVREVELITRSKTLQEWKELLRGNEGPWAPAALVTEAIDDEQIKATGQIQAVDSDDGPVPVMSSPVEYDERPAGQPVRAPRVGENTEEVLSALGLTAAELGRLHDQHVIGLDQHGTMPAHPAAEMQR
jgi:crotonobetainyl-CoA:carnitine CoA-transferase CaiB-like acyl-CoA transferase